jgi:hypothetical protein
MNSRQLAVAGVVLVIAMTPTILDACRSWQEVPESRALIVASYLVAVAVALSAWRILA